MDSELSSPGPRTFQGNMRTPCDTKPVTAMPIRRSVANKNDEAENNQNTINTKPEPVETDKTEPVGTDNKERIIGTFVTKTVGIRKHKKE